MATLIMYPDPPVLTFDKPPKKKKTKHEQQNTWELCITEQFPVVNYVEKLNEKVICDIGPPHNGYKLETTLHKKKFNGKAVLRDPEEKTIAKFHFANGIAMGKCTLYYPSGEVFFRGKLKDGYRDGYGVEYNLNGDEVFTGFFKMGVRNDHIVKVNNMSNCWAETNNRNEVTAILHKNEKGEDHGLCAFYEDGNLYKMTQFENGKELYPVYLINIYRHSMEYYYKGVLKYKGTFKRRSSWCCWRHGVGNEYASDGTTIIYHGTFYNNRYHGVGSYFYKNGKESCFHEWLKGYPYLLLRILWIVSFLFAFIALAIGFNSYDVAVFFICYPIIIICLFTFCFTTCFMCCN